MVVVLWLTCQADPAPCVNTIDIVGKTEIRQLSACCWFKSKRRRAMRVEGSEHE